MSIYRTIIRPALFEMDAERMHKLSVKALQIGLSSSFAQNLISKNFTDRTTTAVERFGLTFNNPLGVAAGFDKNGVVVNQLASLGFGFVEVGTVTFEPQPGNPKPRLFRLPDDKALINRLGFNNQGAFAIAERLKKIDRKCVVGVNIGKNKDVPNEDATENYLKSFDLVHPVADYIAVNISSPNTPNLRELQKADQLEELLRALQQRNTVLSSNFSWQNATERPTKVGTQNIGNPNAKPLLIKIAPDLTEAEIETVVDIALRYELSGIIATNTTISRDGLKTGNVEEIGAGGLSGKPLTARSTEVISTIYRYSKGKLPIIGVGGIFTPEDAFAKIAAGASLIQAYTGFIYSGPAFAKDVNRGLAAILQERGFNSLNEAIGSAARS